MHLPPRCRPLLPLAVALLSAIITSWATSAAAQQVDHPAEPLPLPGTDSAYGALAPENLSYEPELPAAAPAVYDEPEAADTAGSQVLTTDSEGREIAPTVRRFQYAVVVAARAGYTSNVNLASGNRFEDFYFRIEPTLTLGFGDMKGRQGNFLQLDYSPDAVFYTERSESNALQHVVRLAGQAQFTRLTLGVSQAVQILEGADLNLTDANGFTTPSANLDATGRRRQNIFRTGLDASYQLGGKTSLSSSLGWAVADYRDLISSETLSGNVFLNYTYSPKLTFGLGGSAGKQFVDEPSPDSTFEQANLRVSYNATGKLSFNASGGIEFRQSENGDTDHTSPVFDLGLSYLPFDGTVISLSGSRRSTNSAVLAGQDYASTQISASLRQRLFQRVHLSVSAGYTNLDYFSTIAGVASTRGDDYYFVQPDIDVRITRFWSAGAYFLYRQNNSSFSNFSFHDNQAGLRTALRF